MDNKIAEAYVEVGADMKPMEAAFRSIRSSLTRMANMRFNLPVMSTGLLGAAGTGAAGGGLFKMVDGAADLNETISKVGVMFEDQAKVVTRAADEMAKAFGVPKREFLDGAAKLGNYARSAKYTTKQSADLSIQLAKLALDASSIQNIPVAEAFDKIAAALRGEAEPISSLGVIMNEATTKAIAVQMGLAKAGEELSNTAKFAARAQSVILGLSYAQGDLERTSSGAKNQARNLSGTLQNLSDTIGSTIMPAYNQFLSLLNEVATSLQAAADNGSGAWSSFVASVASSISTVRVVFRNLGDFVQRWQMSMVEQVAKVVEGFVYAGQVIYAALRFAFENAATLAMDALTAIQTAVTNMSSNFIEMGRSIGEWVASGFQDQFQMNLKPIMAGFQAKSPEFKLPEMDRRFSQAMAAQVRMSERKIADNEAKFQAGEAAKAAKAPGINARSVTPDAPKKEKLESEFIGLSEFAKKIQAGSLNKDKSGEETARNTRRAADALEEIRRHPFQPGPGFATGPA